jgi:hypothetical protein
MVGLTPLLAKGFVFPDAVFSLLAVFLAASPRFFAAAISSGVWNVLSSNTSDSSSENSIDSSDSKNAESDTLGSTKI